MLRAHEVRAFVGKRGSGKSTRAKALLGECLQAGQRVIVFDPHREYAQDGRASEEVRLGPLPSSRELWEVLADPSELLEGDTSFAVVPESLELDDLAKGFDALAQLAYNAGDLTFAADELVLYFESLKVQRRLNFLATQSRHQRMPLVLAAQRMVHIPLTARTQITGLDTGRQDDPDDLAAIAKRAGKDFAAQVAKLPKGKSMVWQDD